MTARTRAERAISERVAAGRPSDSACSAELCESLVAELFAGRAPTLESIHARLSRWYARCDSACGEFSALAPSRDVDACLRRLVAIARGELTAPALRGGGELTAPALRGGGELTAPALRGGAELTAPALRGGAELTAPALRGGGEFGDVAGEAERLAITRALRGRIAGDAGLSRQADEIRAIAACAETQLEYTFSRLLRAKLRADTRGSITLREGLSEFPYVESYAQLIRAELRLLQASPAPLFLRDRAVARLSVVEQRALRSLQLQTVAYLAGIGAWPLRSGTPASQPAWSGGSIAVCGCGPLPISGLMLQLATGAELVLIDRSEAALTCARELVDELARSGAIPRAAITFRLGDAAQLRYGRGLAPHPDNVACDVVVVASLIPQPAKLRLAQGLRANAPRTPLAVIVRSAGGLCADLIYERVPTEQLGDLPLIFCGESVPRHQVFESLDAATAAHCEVSALGNRELLAIADPQVLNSSELYYRIPQLVAGESAGPCQWGVRYLEQVRQMLRE